MWEGGWWEGEILVLGKGVAGLQMELGGVWVGDLAGNSFRFSWELRGWENLLLLVYMMMIISSLLISYAEAARSVHALAREPLCLSRSI